MGEALLLHAAAQNGVNSSTLFRCNVAVAGVGGGTLHSLVLQRNEARALREH